MTDTEALRKAAEAALPLWLNAQAGKRSHPDDMPAADTFIALANPAAILSLLDLLASEREALERAEREASAQVEQAAYQTLALEGRAETAEAALAAAREANEALAAELATRPPRSQCGDACYADSQDPACILEGQFSEQLAAAREEIGRLREALEPFAEAAASYDPETDGDGSQAAWAHDFTIASLRRARAALSAMGGEPATPPAPAREAVKAAHSPDYLRGYQDAVKTGIAALQAAANAQVAPAT